MGLSTTVAEDFDGFYAAHFRDTVAMAYTLTADLGEAQDIAQEAFARAWRRWQHIRGYENPVAWVRHVAVNLARSRWRRMKVATALACKLAIRPDAPELNPDHVAVVAALRKLPARQREALVLHHIMDLPLVEVAEHLDVPVGTVKSWLHRGRAALADDLRTEVSSVITTPPAETVRRKAGSRARVAVATALALVAVAAGTLLILHLGPGRKAPLPPAISPSPSPTPSVLVDPADPMLKVEWSNTVLTFPAIGGCAGGQVRIFDRDKADAFLMSADDRDVGVIALDRIVLGDLNGDGRAEAVIPMRCDPRPQLIPDAYELGVFERHSDGTVHLAAITQGNIDPVQAFWIDSGVVYVHTIGYPPRPDHLGELRAFRVNGNALTPSGTAPYPPITDVNLTPMAKELHCGLAAPEPEPRLRFDAQLLARAGQREFTILRPGEKPVFAERGRDGLPYLVLTIGCRALGGDFNWDSTTVVFDRIGVEWLAVKVE